jgi:hypothetical protein
MVKACLVSTRCSAFLQSEALHKSTLHPYRNGRMHQERTIISMSAVRVALCAAHIGHPMGEHRVRFCSVDKGTDGSPGSASSAGC